MIRFIITAIILMLSIVHANAANIALGSGAAMAVGSGAAINGGSGAGEEPACTDSNPEGDCSGLIICQNFEGAGYDNSESWSEDTDGVCTGCVTNEDYTTAPLRGSQSLLVTSGNAPSWTVNTFSAETELYNFFRFKVTDMPNTAESDILTLLSDYSSGSPTSVIGWLLSPNGSVKIYSMNAATYGGDEATSSSGVVSINTEYCAWFYGTKGSGSNAVAWLRIAEPEVDGSCVMPETNLLSVSSGHAIGDIIHSQISTYHDSAYTVIYDQFLVSDSPIGDVCP